MVITYIDLKFFGEKPSAHIN